VALATVAPPSADLAITKSGPPTATAGSPITYTVVATDNGPSPATGVVVTDTLPAALSFNSAASSQGSCSNASGAVTCSLGDLATGASATITLSATPTSVGTTTNTATVRANEADPNPANNSASATTVVSTAPLRADVAITKTGPPTATVRSPITYTLRATDNGPNGATGVVVTDTLPSGLGFVSASSTQGSCSLVSGKLSCGLGSLARGATATITVVANAPATPTTVTNTATVKANEADPNPANDSASATTQVVPAPAGSTDLSIAKYAVSEDFFSDAFQVGHPFWYILAVRNSGPATATGVVTTDQLPAGLTYSLSVPSQGSCTQAAGKVTCTLGTMTSGRTAFVGIRVIPTRSGSLTNTATVSGNQPDPNPANNSGSVTVIVKS
jgi:uncharacterized repeat protein (TIGR01451 family)